MATFAFVLDGYVKSNDKQSIKFRVTIDRENIRRNTGFEVLKRDWDKRKQRVKASNSNFIEINDALARILNDAEREFAGRSGTGARLKAKDLATATFATHDFYKFAESQIKLMTGDTQIRTRRKYVTWLKMTKEFMPEMTFEQIDVALIERYRAYLKKELYKHNTIIGRMTCFRALLNMAPAPLRGRAFDEVKVGTFRPAEQKVPLTAAEITKLWNYKPSSPERALARDMFLFSYYAAGMRIGDVITLRHTDIQNGKIVYREGKKRHISSNTLYIPLNSFAQELIDRQPQTGIYIFGELKGKTAKDLVKQIDSREASMNNTLFKIGVKLKIDKHISSKLARDTFADIANKRSNRNVYGISMAMGHGRLQTTELYLGKDQSGIDELLTVVYQSIEESNNTGQ